ncbi:hypothetical protein CDG81_14435 [Actinopolyspora erythraea]|uniref:SalK n=1 Tax=Actinopolyspora erythraea TaxID=414996 RepID=A0A099D3G7_9ACTN|nr:hypothetical protein [Actinopolyspora erythraea]ASU81122.1 hypothetical protein CDG81_14435 [Actinopolyspora erythraea]KGI80728.1 SalK [Actinopolyspora erythraea]
MQTQAARDAKKALDLPHAMIYFAPELQREMAEVGLDSWSRAYFASRAAPLGAVGPKVVAATFYNFNPELVRRHIPAAWSIASPADIVAARFRAVSGALERMLDAETLRSEAVEEAGRLAAKAAEGCSPAGKPLFAAHAEIEYPTEPHLRLWHALTLLREFRGDAHIAVLQHAGLGPLQAPVLQSSAGRGMNAATLKETRAWSEEQWTDAQLELADRGLLDSSGAVTTAGEQLLDEIEHATDAASLEPWRNLDTSEFSRLLETGGALSEQLAEAGAVPKGIFEH